MNILKHSESKTRNTAPLIDTHGYPYPDFYFILMHIYVAVKQKKTCRERRVFGFTVSFLYEEQVWNRPMSDCIVATLVISEQVKVYRDSTFPCVYFIFLFFHNFIVFSQAVFRTDGPPVG